MTKHPFLLCPSNWIGEGTIWFTESPDTLKYYTRWQMGPSEAGIINGTQQIEVEGVPEKMANLFTFFDFTTDAFGVSLQNGVVGTIEGKGAIDDKVLAWEFRAASSFSFEGFEVYELQDSGGYHVHAEYASTDQLRTIVDGRLWIAEYVSS